MKHILLFATALALGACSAKPLESAENKTAEATANEMKIDARLEHIVAVQGPGAVAPGLPVSKPPAATTNPNFLPTAFQGRWGQTTADCDIARSDTKGLLTIRDDKLKFYESTATITALDRASDVAVTAHLAFEGEGQKWDAINGLSLTAAGTGLVRTEPSPVKTYRYERC